MGRSRVGLGVIGLGAVAQAVHLPIPPNRGDLFEVTAVCDLLAGRFGLGTAGRCRSALGAVEVTVLHPSAASQLVHDLAVVRLLAGDPERVDHAGLWPEGAWTPVAAGIVEGRADSVTCERIIRRLAERRGVELGGEAAAA